VALAEELLPANTSRANARGKKRLGQLARALTAKHK